MTIGEILKYKDINTYNKLIQMYKAKIDKPKKIKYIIGVDMDNEEESKKYPTKVIELGCSVEKLMGHDSYSRSGGKIKQRRWN